jgi:dihydropteroate synthase
LLAADLETWLSDPARRPIVMGVLNVTPDSFSDGGRYADPRAAADHAACLAAEGADIIDIGGESTRPGSTPVAAAEQIRRVVPAIEAIRLRTAVAISIDTTQWPVAQAALAAGANWVNDISAGRDDAAMLPAVAAAGAPIILMHMQGRPKSMQDNPTYSDVTREVGDFLQSRIAAAEAAGISRRRILLDPGIGFGKRHDHSLSLLRDLKLLADLGQPLVVGASRKSFIGKILAEPDPLRRGAGDAAIISWAIANHTGVLRVHDVAAAAQVLRVTRAVMRGAAE